MATGCCLFTSFSVFCSGRAERCVIRQNSRQAFFFYVKGSAHSRGWGRQRSTRKKRKVESESERGPLATSASSQDAGITIPAHLASVQEHLRLPAATPAASQEETMQSRNRSRTAGMRTSPWKLEGSVKFTASSKCDITSRSLSMVQISNFSQVIATNQA